MSFLRVVSTAFTLSAFLLLPPAKGEEIPDLSEVDSHEKLIELVENSQEAQFFEGISNFDSALKNTPDDSIVATEKCRFISYFTYSEDFYIEEANTLLEESERYLDRFTNDPFVEIYRLDLLYGQEFIDKAKSLIGDKEIPWSNEQLASLHLKTAQQLTYIQKPQQSGKHAKKSHQLNPTINSQLLYARSLVTSKKEKEALEVLEKSFEGETSYQKREKMNLFSELGNKAQALRLLDELADEEDGIISQLEIARIRLRADQIEKARTAFSNAMKDEWNHKVIAEESFKFELKHGSPAQQLDAYNLFRDQGFKSDPILYYRVKLFISDPSLPLKGRDFLGALAWLGMILGVCLAPPTLDIADSLLGTIATASGKNFAQDGTCVGTSKTLDRFSALPRR